MFFVAYFDIDVRSRHIAGVHNCTADHLSCNNLRAFFCVHPQGLHTFTTTTNPVVRDGRTRLDIHPIQEAVHHYFENGLAPSTRQCYNAGQQRYLKFCTQANITPFPVTEQTYKTVRKEIDKLLYFKVHSRCLITKLSCSLNC